VLATAVSRATLRASGSGPTAYFLALTCQDAGRSLIFLIIQQRRGVTIIVRRFGAHCLSNNHSGKEKMSNVAPAIYTGPAPAPPVSAGWRLASLVISAGCLSVLLVAAKLTPNPEGVATHTALGLQECQFLAHTGLPCPSCGMTTSFSLFVRGKIFGSLWVQPMGTVLAIITTLTFWIALYVAITGKPIARLMRMVPSRYYVGPLLAWALIAWGWKIFIHLKGIDGWR
jgi:hypothetical protein